MQFSSLLISIAIAAVPCFAQDANLLAGIVTADRAISPVNQTLTGTWVALSRRAAPPSTPIPPAAAVLIVFHNDGTVTGSGAGADSSFNGVWMRVADRKFLITYLVFNYDVARDVASIAKIRMTTQIDITGTTLQGNQEVLVVDPTGNPLFTALGGTHSMIRVAAEKPADFDDFLARP
jgi:hypothetical protein